MTYNLFDYYEFYGCLIIEFSYDFISIFKFSYFYFYYYLYLLLLSLFKLITYQKKIIFAQVEAHILFCPKDYALPNLDRTHQNCF